MNSIMFFAVFGFAIVPPVPAAQALFSSASQTSSKIGASASAFLFADSDLNMILAVLFAVACIAVVIYGFYARKKRREALKQLAEQIKFSFDAKGDAFRARLNGNLHIFKLGHSRKVYNVLCGPCSTGEVALFEFQYTQSSGQQQSNYNQTIAAFAFPDATLPNFHLGSKHWWHKVGRVLGFQMVTFDSHPRFSERYLLRGPDEAAIRQFFTPGVLEYLESLPERPAWSIEAASPWLLVYQPSRSCRPAELVAFRDATAGIAGDFMSRARPQSMSQAARG
jgi:hypothetical protein